MEGDSASSSGSGQYPACREEFEPLEGGIEFGCPFFLQVRLFDPGERERDSLPTGFNIEVPVVVWVGGLVAVFVFPGLVGYGKARDGVGQWFIPYLAAKA